MKRSLVILTVLALGFLFLQNVYAQITTASENQTVTFQVKEVTKLLVSGNPGALIIDNGVAGNTALNSVSDLSTTYSMTHNGNSTVPAKKITAVLNADMPPHTALLITLASTDGTSVVEQPLSATGHDVVTDIPRGADADQIITYKLTADATAGVLASDTRTVTLTVITP